MDRFDKLLARIRAAVIAGQRRAHKRQEAPEHHTDQPGALHAHKRRTPSHSTHAGAHHGRRHAGRGRHPSRKGGRR